MYAAIIILNIKISYAAFSEKDHLLTLLAKALKGGGRGFP